MVAKPDCFNCTYRHNLTDSAHSWCNHPYLLGWGNNPGGVGLGVSITKMPRVPLLACMALEITSNSQGIQKGCFNWPYNFDPVWLNSCRGVTMISHLTKTAIEETNEIWKMMEKK